MRLISLILIVCHAAGQLACIPHVHSRDVLHSGHLLEPHVHLGHYHESERCHDCHSNHVGYASHDGLDEVQIAFDHDADAVYLPPAAVAVKADISRLSVQSTLVVWLGPLMPTRSSTNGLVNIVGFNANIRTANSAVWHCAPFLEVCSLRI